jgi:hypothetical protein
MKKKKKKRENLLFYRISYYDFETLFIFCVGYVHTY